MNAMLIRDQTYKFGTFKFHGKMLSRPSIKALQVVYGQWNRNEIPFRSLLGVAKAFGLTLVQ
jgi:hypothetical protein